MIGIQRFAYNFFRQSPGFYSAIVREVRFMDGHRPDEIRRLFQVNNPVFQCNSREFGAYIQTILRHPERQAYVFETDFIEQNLPIDGCGSGRIALRQLSKRDFDIRILYIKFVNTSRFGRKNHAMAFQKQFAQMSIYAHSIEKIACIDGGISYGNFFYLDFFLQQFPEAELHLQPFERKKGIIFQCVNSQHIAYHQVERKAQGKPSDRDIQAGRTGCKSRCLIYRKPLYRRQIEQDNSQQKQEEWRGDEPQPPSSFPRRSCYNGVFLRSHFSLRLCKHKQIYRDYG